MRRRSSSTTVRHSRDVASTLALSTLVSRRRRVERERAREQHDPSDLVLRCTASCRPRAGRPSRRRPPGARRSTRHRSARGRSAGRRPRAARAAAATTPTSAGWTLTGRRLANRPRLAAQREQRLLRPDRRRRVGPLRPADRAEQDRVGRPADLDVLGADRDAVGVDRGAAGEDLRPLDGEAEPAPGRIEHAPGGIDDLRARRRRPGSPRCGTSEVHASITAGPRSVRWFANATATPLISAPWSLLVATR